MEPAVLQYIADRFGFDTPQPVQVSPPTVGGESAWEEKLLADGVLTEAQILEARGAVYGLPVVTDLSLSSLPKLASPWFGLCRQYLIAPLGEGRFAMHNPAVVQPLDDLINHLWQSRPTQPENHPPWNICLAPRKQILAALYALFHKDARSVEELVLNLPSQTALDTQDGALRADLLDDTRDAPVIKLVNRVLSKAVSSRASDIHIEPYETRLQLRMRVDGVLHDILSPPNWMQASLITRIKIMASLDIAERRLPQDGRIQIHLGDEDVDIRVSITPTRFGERAVLRLLNQSSQLLSLDGVGVNETDLALLGQLAKVPNGMLLATGPTGSGKTTTLYAILQQLRNPGINIITIEDPVEYQLEGVNQIQVNPPIGLTFAAGLRSIIRQDPDVILVGEIRDRETAEIAVQSALTGHLVLSTLHTNDAAGAVTRLADLGIEPFLISSSLVGVVSQRLVRTLCPHCKRPVPASIIADRLSLLGEVTETSLSEGSLMEAVGCDQCLNSGYMGRVGLFEIMPISDVLQKIILETQDTATIRSHTRKLKLNNLISDGRRKVIQGLTTVEEVLRVAYRPV